LQSNRRASWQRHVDSRLDAMATAARRGAGRSTSSVSGDGARRRRGATAPGGGAGEADLRRGSELQHGPWRNRAAAAKSCSGGAGGGGMEGASAGRKFQPVVYSRASEEMLRAAADASHLVLRIVQTPARPKKIAAPLRIPCLLEGRFRLRTRYTGVFFITCAL
jgi:hypothetical protein